MFKKALIFSVTVGHTLRVSRHSGQRRIRRFENAFFEDPMQEDLDEEALQEHLHVKVEWRLI